MRRLIRWLTPRWTWTTKCRGCADTSPHSHHLTRLGSIHFATYGAHPGTTFELDA